MPDCHHGCARFEFDWRAIEGCDRGRPDAGHDMRIAGQEFPIGSVEDKATARAGFALDQHNIALVAPQEIRGFVRAGRRIGFGAPARGSGETRDNCRR